ncbi:hypothetical protein D3C77_494400 [compost metagenome]
MQLHFSLTRNNFQILGARHLLNFNHHRSLTVLLSNLHFPLMILGTDVQRLLGIDSRLLELQALFFLDLEGFSFLAGADSFDLPLLAGLCISLLALQRQGRFTGLDVFLLDRKLFIAFEFIGDDVLSRGQFSDLADTLGVENVARIERALRRLLQVVDCNVLENVAVQVVTDHFEDTITEILAFLEQLDKIKLLAGCF